jgi:hypothetical protein
VAPVIGGLACQDIRVADMQRIVNAASTAQEGGRLHALVSALVGAGIRGGYLANARLKEVHWQAGQNRPTAAPKVTWPGSRRCSSIQPRFLGMPMSPSWARRWTSAVRGV